jgi:hypothetical protein
MIMVKTNHSCLRVGCHSWYQSIMGIVHHVRSYFQKPMVRKYLDAHIRTIVVLKVNKLTGFLLSDFTLYNLLSCNNAPMLR